MQPRRPHGHGAPPIFTTMWPISPAAPRPSHGLPSRIEAAADAGAPEHAEQRLVAPAGAERELGVGRDLRRRCRSRPACRSALLERVGERERPVPVGQVARRRRPCPLRVDRARASRRRRPRAPRSRRRPSSAASRMRRGHRVRDVGRAALGGRRPRAPGRAPRVAVHDRRPGSWCRRDRCRHARPRLWRSGRSGGRRRSAGPISETARVVRSRRQRPARPVSQPLVLGVDVGGTKVAVGAVDGPTRARRGRAPDRPAGTEALLDGFEAACEVIERAGQPAAIGVGVPSQIEFATGTVVTSVNIPLDGRAAARGAGTALRRAGVRRQRRQLRRAGRGADSCRRHRHAIW